MKGKCSGLSGTSRSGKKRSPEPPETGVKSRNKVRCMEQEVYKPHPSLIHYEAWSKHKNFKLNQVKGIWRYPAWAKISLGWVFNMQICFQLYATLSVV